MKNSTPEDVFSVFDNMKVDDRLKQNLLNIPKQKLQRGRKKRITASVAAAAILCVTIFGILEFKNLWKTEKPSNIVESTSKTDDVQSTNSTSDTLIKKELPILSYNYEGSGMGFGEYMLKDFKEGLRNSPILDKEDEIKTLPVYKNPSYTGAILDENYDFSRLEERANEIIELFNLGDVTGVIKQDEREHDILPYCEIYGKEYSVNVKSDDTVNIHFYIPPPSGFVFENTKEKHDELLDYYSNMLKDKIYKIWNVDFNKKDIYIPSYSYDGSLNFYDYMYRNDENSSLSQQFIQFSFQSLQFYINSEGGGLMGLSGNSKMPDNEDKIEDYPIISDEEAIREFKSGNFISSVTLTDEELKRAEVVKCEIEYFKQSFQKYTIPVYKIYALFGEEGLTNYYNDNNLKDGLKTYVAFYVPAISKEYLEFKPEYKFN